MGIAWTADNSAIENGSVIIIINSHSDKRATSIISMYVSTLSRLCQRHQCVCVNLVTIVPVSSMCMCQPCHDCASIISVYVSTLSRLCQHHQCVCVNLVTIVPASSVCMCQPCHDCASIISVYVSTLSRLCQHHHRYIHMSSLSPVWKSILPTLATLTISLTLQKYSQNSLVQKKLSPRKNLRNIFQLCKWIRTVVVH